MNNREVLSEMGGGEVVMVAEERWDNAMGRRWLGLGKT